MGVLLFVLHQRLRSEEESLLRGPCENRGKPPWRTPSARVVPALVIRLPGARGNIVRSSHSDHGGAAPPVNCERTLGVFAAAPVGVPDCRKITIHWIRRAAKRCPVYTVEWEG